MYEGDKEIVYILFNAWKGHALIGFLEVRSLIPPTEL